MMWMALLLACWVSSKDNPAEQIDDTNQSDTADTSDTVEPTDTGEPQDTADGVTVRIEESTVYNDSTVTCTVEGAEGGVYFQWLLDDNHFDVQSNEIDLNAFSEDQPGQTLSCEVLSTDNDSVIGKDSIVIANRLPSDLHITISPSAPRAGQDDVTCAVSAFDSDGQTLTISYEWTDGGSASIASDVLPASETSEGETWDCTASISDGIGTVTHADSVTITASGCGFGNCDLSIPLGNGQVADFVQILAGTSPTGMYSLSNQYYIMTTEVTQGMFHALMGYESHVDKNQVYGVGDDYPAYYLSWHMAADLANAMTRHSNDNLGTSLNECYDCSGTGTSVQCSLVGQPYACNGYALPTYAQWKTAARSGTAEDFWTPNGGGSLQADDCGDGIGMSNAKIMDGINDPPLADFAWFCANASDPTHTNISKPVALKAANGFGLYDMQGNVFEWSQDTDGCVSYGPTNPYCNLPQPTSFLLHGGSWESTPSALSYSSYAIFNSTHRDSLAGVRLVRQN